eukprot:3758572-Alexandrium_andersonii.AAC.1
MLHRRPVDCNQRAPGMAGSARAASSPTADQEGRCAEGSKAPGCLFALDDLSRGEVRFRRCSRRMFSASGSDGETHRYGHAPMLGVGQNRGFV